MLKYKLNYLGTWFSYQLGGNILDALDMNDKTLEHIIYIANLIPHSKIFSPLTFFGKNNVIHTLEMSRSHHFKVCKSNVVS